MQELYDALWDAGQEFGICNFGLYAVNSLRIEKAYRGWGAELTNEVTMLDADMNRFIRFDKDDFVGKLATLKQAEQGLSWKLVYFEIDAIDSDVRGGEPVFAGDLCIGITTSGGYGHYVQKSLGFAYVDIAYANAGACFDVGLLGERRNASVLVEPVYDPTNHNLRA
jgi:dimethylglycine dehydrogenase